MQTRTNSRSWNEVPTIPPAGDGTTKADLPKQLGRLFALRLVYGTSRETDTSTVATAGPQLAAGFGNVSSAYTFNCERPNLKTVTAKSQFFLLNEGNYEFQPKFFYKTPTL